MHMHHMLKSRQVHYLSICGMAIVTRISDLDFADHCVCLKVIHIHMFSYKDTRAELSVD